MKTLISLSLAVVIVIAGCKKDEEPVITRTDLLTKNKGWLITAATVSPGIVIGTSSYTDFYSLMSACDKDDLLVINAAGTYKEENSIKCDNFEPSVKESGTWAFNSSETILSFNPSGDASYEYSVLELSGSILKVSYQFTLDNSGTVYTLIGIYTAQ